MRAVGSWLVNKHGQHVYSAECKKKRTYLQRESPSGDDAGQMEMRTNLDCGVLTQPNESNRIETNRNSINDQWKDLTGGPKGGGGGGVAGGGGAAASWRHLTFPLFGLWGDTKQNEQNMVDEELHCNKRRALCCAVSHIHMYVSICTLNFKCCAPSNV